MKRITDISFQMRHTLQYWRWRTMAIWGNALVESCGGESIMEPEAFAVPERKGRK